MSANIDKFDMFNAKALYERYADLKIHFAVEPSGGLREEIIRIGEDLRLNYGVDLRPYF